MRIKQIPILKIHFFENEKKIIKDRISEILDSGILTMGKYTSEFENLFCKFSGIAYSVAVNSGTSAIEIIIRALEIEGSSIIVPTNTFLATALSVMHSGNRVIFSDSNKETFCLDLNDITRRIENDTKAIILVHIGGIITKDYYKIKEICDKRNIYLIEDCAHAHGCSIDGKQAGTLGIAGAFSFFPTKVLVTGEGGIVTTNNKELYEKMMTIRNHGKNPNLRNKMSELGYNYRLSELTAIIGVQQMEKAKWIIEERQKIAKIYDKYLREIEDIKIVKMPENIKSTYYKYIVYLSENYNFSKVKQVMKEKYGVSLTGEVYSDLCHNEPIWQKYTYCGKLRRIDGNINCNKWPNCGCGKLQNNFPGAEFISKHHICLPLYPGLEEKEIIYVVESLDKTLKELK